MTEVDRETGAGSQVLGEQITDAGKIADIEENQILRKLAEKERLISQIEDAGLDSPHPHPPRTDATRSTGNTVRKRSKRRGGKGREVAPN